MGSVNLLESVRKTRSVKAVINVTSDKCYENREWVWGYRENDPMGGYDPYSNSKGCAELVTASYRSSFFNKLNYSDHGVAVASARAGNVIGGGDWSSNRLIPDFIRAIELNQMATIRSPNSIRPWQYVLDPLRGYLVLAEKLYIKGSKYSEAWNFGPNDNDTKTVEWIITEFVNNWEQDIKFKINPSQANHHEAKFLKLDCSKAQRELGWRPQSNITETIKRICEWHQAHLSGNNMKKYTLDEIERYQNCILKF
jgi:CDP-glucose 4,6-dehydratase